MRGDKKRNDDSRSTTNNLEGEKEEAEMKGEEGGDWITSFVCRF